MVFAGPETTMIWYAMDVYFGKNCDKNMDQLLTVIYHKSMLFFEAQLLRMVSFVLLNHADVEQVLKFCE